MENFYFQNPFKARLAQDRDEANTTGLSLAGNMSGK